MVGCEVRKVATFSVVVCKVLSSLIAVCGDASLLRSALSISFVTSEGWNLQACFRTISSRSGTAVWAWPLKSPLSFAGSRWAILLARSDLGGQPGITGSELSLNVTGFAGRTPLS